MSMRGCLLLCALVACGDSNPAPFAAVVRASPGELDPADDAADDLTITIDYRDGDGDLGGGAAAITDCRAGDLAIELPLPPIASDQAVADGVPIEGTIDL